MNIDREILIDGWTDTWIDRYNWVDKTFSTLIYNSPDLCSKKSDMSADGLSALSKVLIIGKLCGINQYLIKGLIFI